MGKSFVWISQSSRRELESHVETMLSREAITSSRSAIISKQSALSLSQVILFIVDSFTFRDIFHFSRSGSSSSAGHKPAAN